MDSKTVESRAQRQPRLEDDPLVRGLGRYAADVPMTGQAHAFFVRSPHAFADIRSIDTEAAKAVPGRAGRADRRRHGGDRQCLPAPAARRPRRHKADRSAPSCARRPPPCAMSARRSPSWSPRRSPRRRTPPSSSTVDYEERTPGGRPARRGWRRARRKSGRRRRAISRSTGPDLAADPDANAKEVDRVIAAATHVARVAIVHQRIHGPLDGAARRDRELRCRERQLLPALLLAERARVARRAWPPLWAFPRSGCGSSPRTSAGPSD